MDTTVFRSTSSTCPGAMAFFSMLASSRQSRDDTELVAKCLGQPMLGPGTSRSLWVCIVEFQTSIVLDVEAGPTESLVTQSRTLAQATCVFTFLANRLSSPLGFRSPIAWLFLFIRTSWASNFHMDLSTVFHLYSSISMDETGCRNALPLRTSFEHQGNVRHPTVNACVVSLIVTGG